MAVEFDPTIVFGVDQKREVGLAGTHRSARRIPKKKLAETLPTKLSVDGTDPYGGKGRITGEASDGLGG
jgi:hypothetical protein